MGVVGVALGFAGAAGAVQGRRTTVATGALATAVGLAAVGALAEVVVVGPVATGATRGEAVVVGCALVTATSSVRGFGAAGADLVTSHAASPAPATVSTAPMIARGTNRLAGGAPTCWALAADDEGVVSPTVGITRIPDMLG